MPNNPISRRDFGKQAIPLTAAGIAALLGMASPGPKSSSFQAEFAHKPHNNTEHSTPYSPSPHVWTDPTDHNLDGTGLPGDSAVQGLNQLYLFNQNQVVLTDEFLFGTTEDGEIGELGWSIIIVGTGVMSKQAISGHPGVTRVSSSATAGDNMAVKTPTTSISTGDAWDFRFLAKGASASIANQIIRLGVGQQLELGGSGTVRRGYWFEADDSRSANWLCVTGNNVSRTEVDSGIVVNNSTWHLFRVAYNVATASFDFYIDNMVNPKASINTNLPGNVNAELTILCWTRVTSAIKNVDVDWFRGALIGVLNR